MKLQLFQHIDLWNSCANCPGIRSEFQCWRSGECTRLLSMWPGFDSRTRRHMWVEFVGCLLCSERFFAGTPVFPSHPKNQHLIWLVLIWFPVSPMSRALCARLNTLETKWLLLFGHFTSTAKKGTKTQNARAGRIEPWLFLLVKQIVFCRSCSRPRRQ